LVLVFALIVVSTACAPKLPSLSTGSGSAFPEYATAYQQAIEACRGVRTMAAVLAIAGRAAGQRFPRANIDAGFEAPDRVMLELPAPGRPIFTFVANGNSSTLILARDGRVLEGAPPADTLEALTGIRLGPADLRAIITGCGFGYGEPKGGRVFADGTAAIDAGDVVSYLARRDDRWQLIAARRGPWDVFYDEFVGGRPAAVRLVSSRDAGQGNRGRTDLRIRLSQVDIDQPIDARAFSPEIPSGVRPITLEELRQAGPLGR
jgi:hypothetical protein